MKAVAYQVAVEKVVEKAATAARRSAKEVAELWDEKFVLPDVDEAAPVQLAERALQYAKEKVKAVCIALKKAYKHVLPS